jgi:CRISPR system Cascade subunit CasA
MDIVTNAWIPTNVGPRSPASALSQAHTVQWARGDWDSATQCLLVALLQTAVVLDPSLCRDEDQWKELLDASPTDLERWFSTIPLGTDPWQDPTCEGEVPVSALMPEMPGENALKKAADIAVWRIHAPGAITLPEATIALVSDSLWGTGIGAGFKLGARGGQPLTTFVEPADQNASLWRKCWMNVLPAKAWTKRFGRDNHKFVAPWTKPRLNTPLTPRSSHSLTVLWQCPRRWRLIVDDDGMVRRVHRKSHGQDYEGWSHPWTPYVAKEGGERFPARIKAHFGFSDWAGIALNARPLHEPAAVVSQFIQHQWQGEQLRIRLFGWMTNNAEAAAWIENTVPFIVEANPAHVASALNETENARRRLYGALKRVDAKGRLTPYVDRLYAVTETAFYTRVRSDDWADWPQVLRQAAQEVFWKAVENLRLDAYDVGKAAHAL